MTFGVPPAFAQTAEEFRRQESLCMGLWSGILREDIGHDRLEDHEGLLVNMEVLHAKRMAERDNGTVSDEEFFELERANSEAFRNARAAVLALDDPERAPGMREALTQALETCAALAARAE